MWNLFLFLITIQGFLLLVLCADTADPPLTEEVRRAEYYKRGYTWPPSLYIPDTPGWRDLSNRKFDQACLLPSSADRYTLWVQAVASAYVQPNFTENGWGLTRAPQDLVDTLRGAIRSAYEAGEYRNEEINGAIYELNPILIDRPDLTKRVLHELHPMHEAWAGIPLKPNLAYGFRLYRNESALMMHVDKSDTHVISSILHIDSSDDAEPWPIVIEDFLGNTNEVILTPGDMLFYESSKCFHGRPSKFNGSWYSSVFVHYQPADPEWNSVNHLLETHYGVPQIWNQMCSFETSLPDVEMRGTSMREPECPNNWCNLRNAVRWQGPAEFNHVITAGPKKYRLWGENDEL